MHKTFSLAVVGLVMLGGVTLAQRPGRQGVQPVQPVQPGVQPAIQPGGQPAQPNVQHQQGDQQIATLIMTCNRNEVETAKFAMSKIKSDEVKEIATKMIKDHTEGMTKFARWAGHGAQQNTGTRDSGDREERPRDENRREDREEGRRDRDDDQSRAKPTTGPNTAGVAAGVRAPAGTAPANAAQNANQGPNQTVFRPVMGGGLNWVAIHQEIADEALAGCKKELSRYEGNDFDKAYLGHQLGAHMHVLTELKVFKKHVSSQLGAEIDDAISMTEEHIKHLRSTMEEKKDEKSDSKK